MQLLASGFWLLASGNATEQDDDVIDSTDNPRRPRRRKLRRGLTLVSLALAVGAYVIQARHDARAIRPYPMPGVMTDLGSHRLHSYVLGSEGPLVILESGLGGESYTWKPIQSALSFRARVLAYDRAGYGWSEPGPVPRSNLQAVKELRKLLEMRGLLPPYLLVGHSMGGLNMRLFASIYPDDVCGLVLIDAYNRDLFAEDTDVGEMEFAIEAGHALRRFGAPLIMVPGLVHQALANATPEAKKLASQMVAFKSRSSFVDTYVREDREPDWLKARASMRSLGELPVTVITAERPIDRYQDWWPESQVALQRNVANRPRVVIAPCGHAVHLERPDLVIEAVEDLLDQLRVRPGTTDESTDAL